MRVVVNASIYDRRPTGLGVYTFNLLWALVAHPIDLITLVGSPECLPGSVAIGGAVQPVRGLRGHVMRLLWTQTGLRRLCRQVKPDVVLNPVPEGMICSSVPQVTVVHDVIPLLFPRQFPRHQWYFRSYVPRVLRSSVAILAVSEQTRRDVIRHYEIPEHSVVVVPAGVDHRLYSPDIETGPVLSRFGLGRYVLCAGSFAPHKNLERLIRAFVRVRGPVTLAVAGYPDPRHYPGLARLASSLGMSDRVHFLGYVANGELAALYAGACAVVMPSLYEGFGLPVLEAMACGAPVIASTAGALPEVTGDAALLVDPYDEVALAEAIQRVLDDPDLAADLRARGLVRARQFSWAQTARGVLEVINRVVSPA